MDWKKTLLAVAATTGILSVGAIAFAQPAPGGCDGRAGLMRSHMRDMTADPAAFADRRLERLKTDLKITEQQAPLWQDFADKTRNQAGKGMQAMRAQTQDLTLSAPDRMTKVTEVLRQRLAAMEALNESFKRLYASLSVDQQRVADIHAAQLGRGHHGRGRAGPAVKG